MSKPAFFVDGQTEQKIVQRLCPNCPVQITGLNGRDTKISAIAQKLASLIRALGNKYYPIIILLDKEKRDISVEEMAQNVKEGLNKAGLENQDIRIGIADRMIENWIIADWDSFEQHQSKPPQTEGVNGAEVIKRAKKTYHKAIDGVKYFCAANPSIISQNSPSYKHFIEQLKGLNCNYIKLERGK
ncbi:MAG: DUF4276 family protein [Bacteroidales bacterium]